MPRRKPPPCTRRVRIIEWRLVALSTNAAKSTVSSLVGAASTVLAPIITAHPHADVFVEQQSHKARHSMQNLAYAILGVCTGICGANETQRASFISPQSKMRFLDANHRLEDDDAHGHGGAAAEESSGGGVAPPKNPSLTYAERKAGAVAATQRLLQTRVAEPERWMSVLSSASKRDDYADAFLLGLASLERKPKMDRYCCITVDVGIANMAKCVAEWDAAACGDARPVH